MKTKKQKTKVSVILSGGPNGDGTLTQEYDYGLELRVGETLVFPVFGEGSLKYVVTKEVRNGMRVLRYQPEPQDQNISPEPESVGDWMSQRDDMTRRIH